MKITFSNLEKILERLNIKEKITASALNNAVFFRFDAVVGNGKIKYLIEQLNNKYYFI